ncbi:hypothetical protein XA68_17674 [Ophiocordyceps unilateralis]|uniref:Uncharacterized protein n=1 Tax=Ophiocordyceps unilateralis TaxID=268505 RepID=A0A2A9PIV9_OPHUN|nr:hypothetical protein XA68_17674 [Ophiocordyceps unilateralis]
MPIVLVVSVDIRTVWQSLPGTAAPFSDTLRRAQAISRLAGSPDTFTNGLLQTATAGSWFCHTAGRLFPTSRK